MTQQETTKLNQEQRDVAEKLMLLPRAARDQYQSAAEENKRLDQIVQAQNVIIDDLSISVSDFDETQKSISQLDNEISDINKKLQFNQEILLELLSNEKPQTKDLPEKILKSVLLNVIKTFSSISKDAVDNDEISVSLLTLMEVEEQISKIIDNLSQRGLYPETNETNEKRMKESHDHIIKLTQFLQELKDTQ
ncbi:hypothetical protein GPJ56_008420 [Histomonas meleagridis]|uniref:uncharacterized protein n=1 Tax=Histomonas meleagridis TaxID=135588 RepID=UPI00355A2147|nr:hypothetical protein GPJ56_008420 [Histomonas meleagridis]KAH0806476.1 hypothetical protein GO595_000638 [Histomonas meleagridis]